MVNFGEVRKAQLAKSTLAPSKLVPLGSFQISSESKEKLPNLFLPSKTATMVPELAVEDLPLGRTSTLVPEFAGMTCPWAEHSDEDI